MKIEKIRSELSEHNEQSDKASSLAADEHDLSTRKLNSYQTELRALQKDKSERLRKVLEYINEVHYLCGVLGIDFGSTVNEFIPVYIRMVLSNPETSAIAHTGGLASLIDPSELLANIESQILRAKEESLSRKDIMDRINKWIAACDEEAWLEEYNQSLWGDLVCPDQKKLESILLAEKEAIFGSKPSPRRTGSLNRKTNGYRPNGKC
ncbi:hypothetical protein HU200_000420 [Digitaria exilis]|uniref:Uncharacterized protein n=1 Tax=Digitaria exilis TaxID=1010633 RepID=A0A835KX96_9POAL|nr:hypothetical protein HU200_000420 [Digitaria exilis]